MAAAAAAAAAAAVLGIAAARPAFPSRVEEIEFEVRAVPQPPVDLMSELHALRELVNSGDVLVEDPMRPLHNQPKPPISNRKIPQQTAMGPPPVPPHDVMRPAGMGPPPLPPHNKTQPAGMGPPPLPPHNKTQPAGMGPPPLPPHNKTQPAGMGPPPLPPLKNVTRMKLEPHNQILPGVPQPNDHKSEPHILPGVPQPNDHKSEPHILPGVPQPNDDKSEPHILPGVPQPNDDKSEPHILPGVPQPNDHKSEPHILPGVPQPTIKAKLSTGNSSVPELKTATSHRHKQASEENTWVTGVIIGSAAVGVLLAIFGVAVGVRYYRQRREQSQLERILSNHDIADDDIALLVNAIPDEVIGWN